MPGHESEVFKIRASYKAEDGEKVGHLVLTDQRICFYPERWGGLARDQVLWWAHHGTVAHLEQWGTGIFNKGNMLTISIRNNNYDTSVHSYSVKAESGPIRMFMDKFYSISGRRS